MDMQEPSTEPTAEGAEASTEPSVEPSTEPSVEPSVAASDPADARAQFRDLPEQVRVEDTIATHPAAPAPGLTPGDPDTDWLLRNAG